MDVDPEKKELAPERLRETSNGVLGGSIGRVAGKCHEPKG